MTHQIFRSRSLALAMVFSLSLAGCARPVAAPVPNAAPAVPAASTPAPPSVQGLKPGDKIGAMTLSQGPLPFDLAAIPPFPAFCGGSPPLKPDATEGKPGVFTVECTVPTLPKLHIGGGWVSADEKMRDSD